MYSSLKTQLKLIKLAQADDISARNKLVLEYQDMIYKIAHGYEHQDSNSCMTFQDLVGEGNLGLIAAIRTFKFKEKCRPITHFWAAVRGYIQRALETRGRLITQGSYLNDEIRRAIKRGKFAKKGRGESVGPEDVAVYKKGGFLTVEIPPDLLLLCNDSVSYLKNMEDREACERVLDILPSREKKIMRMFYGFTTGQPMFLKDIGKEMNLSLGRVGQLIEAAQGHLRRRLRDNKLKNHLQVQDSWI